MPTFPPFLPLEYVEPTFSSHVKLRGLNSAHYLAFARLRQHQALIVSRQNPITTFSFIPITLHIHLTRRMR